MQTNDPALSKTPIGSHDTLSEAIDNTTHDSKNKSGLINDMKNDTPVSQDKANRNSTETIAGEEVTHEDPLRKAVVAQELAQRDVLTNNHLNNERIENNDRAGGSSIVNDDVASMTRNHDDIEDNTRVNKGTETFNNKVVDSEHVNDGDNPARQPDRRDQQGSTAFDEGINEETVGSEAPKSEDINDMNRYASINNAQSRTLNPDEKD